MEHTTEVLANVSTAQPERKPYSTPTLADFGSLAEITQGGAGTGTDNVIYS
ncbi:MAG TPA: lasso RiPP family leader peptide-containing protein [Thermoanaerobaculia bacterium]|jgi:hypothetical protein|nr:lasso RiPP family leader peptide-containing protein [Thermoanaerobaculia bacterium]